MTRRVHLLSNTSGLSLRVEQVRADHPYAEAWVPEAELTRLREALESELADLVIDIRWAADAELGRLIGRRDRIDAALAALPPPRGGDDEGEDVGC